MTVSYTNTDATSRMLKAMSNGLKRMTDSELEVVAHKLQEWFTLKLTTADFRSWHSSWVGYYSNAPYGALIMSTLNRGVTSSVQSFQVTDTRYNATTTSKTQNAWDNYGDDDDTFDDPADISIVNQQHYYLSQRHYASYTTSTPGFSGQTLTTNGDYYNTIRGWNGTDSVSVNAWSPAEMIRDYGHLTATTDGTVKIEKDVQKIYEAIFKYVNARIRSTDNDKNFGQYKIATSWPGNGWYPVREVMGQEQTYYYYAFSDVVSTVDGHNHFYDLNAYSTRYIWNLWIKNITRNSANVYGDFVKFSGDGFGDSTSARPTRLSRWKITAHSGSALEGTNSGDVREYFATGDYNGIGKYFYFKPAHANGGSIYVSSNYNNSSPSASSFEGSARTVNVLTPDEVTDRWQYQTRNATLAPSGNSADGHIYLYANQKYTATSSFNTNTVYKCERMNRLIEMELPYLEDYDNRWNWNVYYGTTSYEDGAVLGRRRDHYLKNYIQNVLYRLYTLGRYYPIYSLATSVGSSQFDHGIFSNSVRGGTNVTNKVFGPGLYFEDPNEPDTSGTYYKVRGAGAASGYVTDTYYLVSDVDI